MPPTALLAPRGGRRGLQVLPAGLVRYFYRRYAIGLVVASLSIERTGVLAPFLRPVRTQRRNRKAQEPMANTPQNLAALRRAKFNRDRGLRRLSQAVDAQRRLNARRADSTRANADPLGPSDPRHAYLTQSHD